MNNEKIDLPLRDIHLPESVSLWMPMISYVALTCLILLFLILAYFMIKHLIRFLFRPTLKKQAKIILNEIKESFFKTNDATKCSADLSFFLRRLVYSQSTDHAGTTGTAWLQILDQPLKTKEFSEGVGRLLLTSPYSGKISSSEVDDLLKLCSKWVETL